MSSTSDTQVVAGVLRIPLGNLVHGPNARGDLGDVTDLARSLRRLGQQQPILVEPEADGRWSVFDGNRRFKAARVAGITHLLAVPRNSRLDDVQRTIRQLAMHGTAKAFDPIAEGHAVEWLMFADDGPHLSREDIAAQLGRSVAWVKGRIDLVQQLTDVEQAAVATGALSVGMALLRIAASRGNYDPPAARPAAVSAPKCSLGSDCGCRCHKRNQGGI